MRRVFIKTLLVGLRSKNTATRVRGYDSKVDDDIIVDASVTKNCSAKTVSSGRQNSANFEEFNLLVKAKSRKK